MINRFTRAAIGLKKAREKDAIANAHLPAVRNFFRGQAHMVLFRFEVAMRDQFPVTPPIPISFRQMEAKNPEALKKWAELWDSVEYETTPTLQKIVTTIEHEALKAGAIQLQQQLRFDPKSAFSLSNPRAVAFFRSTGGSVDYIKGIQDTTAESLKTVITTALDESWSYNDTASEIEKLYDGPISRDRAELIATNEAGNAYEAGNRAFADSIVDSGVEMEKSWNVSESDVCDICTGNQDDGWISIDQAHSSGDQEPLAHPNCRCFETYRESPGGMNSPSRRLSGGDVRAFFQAIHGDMWLGGKGKIEDIVINYE